MYPATEYMKKLFRQKQRQIIDITVYPISGNDFTITQDDIMQNSLSIDRAAVSGSKVEIGSVIAADLTFKLYNTEGKYDDVIFEGAQLLVKVGIKEWDADRWQQVQMQYMPLGYFTIDEQPRKLASMTVKALDRMVMLDKDYIPNVSFPATVAQITGGIATQCNVTLKTSPATLTNANYVVTIAPEEIKATCRQMLIWLCELSGTCAYFDWDGKLCLEWYTSTPTIITKAERYTSDLYEKSVTITGVTTTIEEVQYVAGTTDYAFNIQGNPLLTGNPSTILSNLYAKIGGFTYTPFSASINGEPYVYPLDKITFTDKLGNNIATIVTNHVWKVNGKSELSGKGESNTRASYATLNPLTRSESQIIESLGNEVNKQLTSREQATILLNEMMYNSMGLYFTEIVQPDGSKKVYSHDRPKLEDSMTIYTMTANGFAFTQTGWRNGSPIWQYGIDKDGNAVFNAISTYKLSADDITTGTLRSQNYIAGVSGMAFNLNNGTISSKNFILDASGNVTMVGKVTATSGSIGGFQITPTAIKSEAVTIYSALQGGDGAAYVQIGPNGNYGMFWGSEIITMLVSNNRPMLISAGGASLNIEGNPVTINGKQIGDLPVVRQGSTSINATSAVTISYSGFASIPSIVATYSTTGSNVSGDLGSIKIYSKTTTSAQIIVGGSGSTSYSIDWIAVGT